MTDQRYSLNSLEDAKKYFEMMFKHGVYGKDAECYCPVCKENRFGMISEISDKNPVIISHTCRQCDSETIVICHKIDGKETLSFVYSTKLGYSSSYVVDSVNYYMGQAFMSKTSGAYSASMAMYRAALECLLFDQGFKNGMLSNKIKEFEDKRPEWSRGLDNEFMGIIKDLGNDSIHPNKGNIDVQKKFDEESLSDVELTLIQLIERAYVQPAKEMERLNRIRSKT